MNKEFCWFMDGWCEASGADDMSDGAGQCVMMEGVKAHNKEEGTRIDPHDGWMYWLKHSERHND